MSDVIGFSPRKLIELERAFQKMTRNRNLLRACTVRLSQRILRSAKTRTHSVSGELRRNWEVAYTQKRRGYIITLSNQAQAARSNECERRGYIITRSNPKKYASYVEYGHRTKDHTGWVKGRFWGENAIRSSIKELPAIVEQQMHRIGGI